jgi:hypothetical protein
MEGNRFMGGLLGIFAAVFTFRWLGNMLAGKGRFNFR